MKPRIVHETEVHRQHVRLKIPIRVEIDGTRYQVDDWSVGGFGVENVVASRQPGERYRCRVIFPFEDFELSMRVEAQMVYVDVDNQRFGCRFLALTTEQLDVFHYVVDAYLSGEIVTAGDLLHVHARSNTAEARAGAPFGVAADREDEPLGRRVRRYAAYAALGLAGLLLLGLIAVGVNERYLTVKAATAVVDAPLYRLRAPIAGTFDPAAAPDQPVSPGQTLALVRGLDGTLAPLESPCVCVVLEVSGLRGQYYQPGEPLITLADADRPPTVRAQVALEDVERLQIGDRATIRFPGRGEALSGQVDRIDLRPRFSAADEGEAPVSRRLAQVWVRPDRTLTLNDLGTLVSVRFP
ncbi:MAG TPA: HlyD family efflux transporter periplasmic adaptor subunit [Geminicoccaceae bacterium]|nr:HlyD family efflux transporter periplasmic adaptor subunit [Geminicoccaceae bacterium]